MAQSAARKQGAPRRVAVTERAANEDPTPLYAAALFKISMALKRNEGLAANDLELVSDRVLDGLGVDPAQFRAYLARNLSLLLATVKMKAG